MKVLALTLAAAVLGTGCIITDDDQDVGSVIVYWDFVRNAPAQPTGAILYDSQLEGPAQGLCPDSGVEVVDILSPAGTVSVNCREFNPLDGVAVQGVIVDRVLEGRQTFRIRGWRGDFVVYESAVTLDVFPNVETDHGVIDVAAVSRPLDLFADLAFGVGPNPSPYFDCLEAGDPDIRLTLFDSFGTLTHDETVLCQDPLPVWVFDRSLDLDNYGVRMRGIATSGPSAGAVVFDSCEVPVDHFTQQVGQNGVELLLRTLPVPSCT